MNRKKANKKHAGVCACPTKVTRCLGLSDVGRQVCGRVRRKSPVRVFGHVAKCVWRGRRQSPGVMPWMHGDGLHGEGGSAQMVGRKEDMYASPVAP